MFFFLQMMSEMMFKFELNFKFMHRIFLNVRKTNKLTENEMSLFGIQIFLEVM